MKPDITIDEVSRNGKLMVEANQKVQFSSAFKDLVSNIRRLNTS